MNLEVIFSYIPLYVEAFFLTVKIGWIGIFLALVIGVFVAFVIHFKVPVLAQISRIYVEDRAVDIGRNLRLSGTWSFGWKLHGGGV